MATSGTVAQTQFDATSMIEAATRRCGVLPAMLSAELLLSAKNNLFLLLTRLSNRGVNLWCIQTVSVPMVPSQAVYVLPAGTVDVMTTMLKDNATGNEVEINKWTREDYFRQTNKTTLGRPLQFWYDKQFAAPQMWFWPVPNDATQTAQLSVQRQPQDVGALDNVLELPTRWYDWLIYALAEVMCLELPKNLVDPARYAILKAKAAETLLEAEDGERDGAPIRISPNISPYTR